MTAAADPACTDYPSAADARAALTADPDLAEHLDTDGDGWPCERRWPRPAPAPDPAATAAPRAAPPIDVRRACSTVLAGTQDHVAQAGHHLAARFGVPLALIGGRADRSGISDHPTGHALDFTVDRGTGDALADYALAHADELAVKYVIWRQRINHGGGWEPMADRGGDTANHFDHVHVSFEPAAGPGLPC